MKNSLDNFMKIILNVIRTNLDGIMKKNNPDEKKKFSPHLALNLAPWFIAYETNVLITRYGVFLCFRAVVKRSHKL